MIRTWCWLFVLVALCWFVACGNPQANGKENPGTTTEKSVEVVTKDTTTITDGSSTKEDGPDSGHIGNHEPGRTPDELAPEPVVEPSVGPEPKPEPTTEMPNPPTEAQPPPDRTAPSSIGLYLYDEDTKSFLLKMQGTVDLKPHQASKMLNLALKVDATVKSVRFQFDNLPARSENAAAFTVFRGGEDHRDKLTKGQHAVTFTAYSGVSLTGRVIDQRTVTFDVLDTITQGSSSGSYLPKDPNQVPPDPTFATTKNVTKTIVISKPGVYDYKNVLHIWKGAGKCNQTENQPHIMRIEASNVTVRNFAYRNAGDGIHIATCGKGQGNTCSGSIKNITLDHVAGWACEDALTTGKGTSNITIRNSFFMGNPNVNFRDKCLQINFGNNLLIETTIFKNCLRPVRFKSGSKITLKGNRFYLFQQAVRGDTYKDISGIVPNQAAVVNSEKNHYQDGSRAFSALGKVTINSVNDTFRNLRDKNETKDGGKVNVR